MFGTGLPEIVIILLVVLLLFGPAVLTFYLGYVVGQNRAADKNSASEAGPERESSDDAEESADE